MSIPEKRAQVSANNSAILENMQKVYDAGVTDGKQAEYDRFWNITQQNGARTNYMYAFQGYAYNANNFYPKYDLKPSGNAQCMFSYWSADLALKHKLDLTTRLAECGIILDTSEVTNFTNMFYYGYPFTRLPAIDMRNATNTTRAFSYMGSGSIELTIDEVNVSETTPYNDTFIFCKNLRNITFKGTIGQSGLNFSWSPLSVASMKSIISCLKDLTGTEGEGVYTILFSSDCWSALEADSTAPDGGTWQQYVGSLGWVI